MSLTIVRVFRFALPLFFTLGAGAAVVAADGVAELRIDGVRMVFDMPVGWKIETSGVSQGQVLVNDSIRASVMPAPNPDPQTRAKYEATGASRDAVLRQSLSQGFGQQVRQMTSEDPEVHPIPGSDPEAFYFRVQMPDGRHAAVGMTYQNGTEVVMMGSTAEAKDLDEVLAIMASVRVGEE